jgi:hypothetical protein
MPKVFSALTHAPRTQIPPNPLVPNWVTYLNSFESHPLPKGDLGGFKNQQSEGIFGKSYKS